MGQSTQEIYYSQPRTRRSLSQILRDRATFRSTLYPKSGFGRMVLRKQQNGYRTWGQGFIREYDPSEWSNLPETNFEYVFHFSDPDVLYLPSLDIYMKILDAAVMELFKAGHHDMVKRADKIFEEYNAFIKRHERINEVYSGISLF